MARIRFVGVFSFALIFITFAVPSFPQSAKSPVGVAGTVLSDQNNAPIARATVMVSEEGGGIVQQCSTGDSGEFSFQGLRPAHYLLRVQAVRFQPTQLQLDLTATFQRGMAVALRPAIAQEPAHTAGATISAHELAMPAAARESLSAGKHELYEIKNPQAALHHFQSAITQAADFYEAFYFAAMADLALQNSAEAESYLRKSVQLSRKKFPDASIALGSLLLQRGQQAEGEEFLRTGLAANPNSWPGQFALGELELSRAHVETALNAAVRAASLAPGQSVVYRLLAVIHLRQKDYPALLSDLDSYIQLDPASPAGQRAKELRTQTQALLANSAAPTIAAE
jgi:tetratricopeptide (TPR) repeat protein